VPTATVYRVEWAPTPAGPWTNFTGAAGVALDSIEQFATGSYTCSVPMCYRVVAAVTNVPATLPVPEGMVVIPAGTNSGTDPDFDAYSLTVEEFNMDETEVTKAKWDEVYAWAVTNGYDFNSAGAVKAANHPVQTVNWYDCVKWCNARSQKDGRTPCYTVSGSVYKTGQVYPPDCAFAANGYRLPTNTEWEYAARGGASSRRFPWGDTIDHSRANYNSFWNSGGPSLPYDAGYEGFDTRYATGGYPYTSPVGAFAANGYGLYDMAGNVREWCWELTGMNRYFRGGNWAQNGYAMRCGNLSWDYPFSSSFNTGFRSVCR